MDPLTGVWQRAGAAAQVFVVDVAAPQLEPDEAHHLSRVLRLRDGEVVVAADGRGGWGLCAYRSGVGGRSEPVLEPTGPAQHEPASGPAVTVAFAPVKGDRPEWVVQKLSELGVDRICPMVTEHSVVRWTGERALKAVERLRRVAREASAQSRRVWLPEVTGVSTLGQLAGFGGLAGLAGFGGLGDGMGAAGLALAELGSPPPADDLVSVAVGPEGGWSQEERELGLAEVGFGPQVLRAETAAVAAGVLLCGRRAGTVASSPRLDAPSASRLPSDRAR